MRFSVLIPVYNVEKYLEQCIQSVLTQDFSDYEVILVNDGSTDQSPMICRQFAEKDHRIKFFDKENEGLLLTRRFSIKHATGEYIVFLDSDDYWEPGILSALNKEIESSHVDLICYRYQIVTDEGKLVKKDTGIFPDRSFFSRENKELFLKEFIESSRLNVLWSKCVKSSIVDKDADYSAFEDKKGEDLLQSIALIRNAETILYMDDVFVNYRMSPSGRGRNFKLKYLYDFNVVKEHIYTNLLSMNVSDSIMEIFFRRYMESVIGFIELTATNVKKYRSFKAACRNVENFPLFKKFCGIAPPIEMNDFWRFQYIKLKKRRYFILYLFYKAKKIVRIFTTNKKATNSTGKAFTKRKDRNRHS
jgi:glycosyltransferase involved in cell wall biosynthesis